MTIKAAFQPKRGANQTVTTGVASASVSIDPVAKSVRIVNADATNIAFIRIGAGAQTASAADLPIRANSEIIVTKGDGEDIIAYIAAAGTPVLYIQTGEGGI